MVERQTRYLEGVVPNGHAGSNPAIRTKNIQIRQEKKQLFILNKTDSCFYILCIAAATILIYYSIFISTISTDKIEEIRYGRGIVYGMVMKFGE